VLKLLHPFIPFVTEEIWQRLPGTGGSIMIEPFPEASEYDRDEKAPGEMDLLMGIITGIRNIRGEMNIPPSKKVDALIEAPDSGSHGTILNNLTHIKNLAKVESVKVDTKIPKPEASATAVCGKNQVHVLLKGLLDFEEEKKRLRKEIGKVQKEIDFSERKLSNSDFVEKAPQEIIEGVKEKLEVMRLQLEKLNRNLHFFDSMKG